LPVELWQIILCLDDAAVELLKEENFGRNASVLEIEVGERSPLRKYSSLLAFMKHVYYGTYRVTDDVRLLELRCATLNNNFHHYILGCVA